MRDENGGVGQGKKERERERKIKRGEKKKTRKRARERKRKRQWEEDEKEGEKEHNEDERERDNQGDTNSERKSRKISHLIHRATGIQIPGTLERSEYAYPCQEFPAQKCRSIKKSFARS